MLLFELSQTLPTLSGLSFQFLLNVSFAAKLNSKLKLNFVNLLQRKFDASSHIDIHPSISIARSGTIVLRAGNIVTGAMITSNLYAATTISQTMEMIEGKKLLFKIDIPHKELFVTKISHDIIKIDSNRYQSFIIRRHSDQKIQKRYCSGDILAKILGIQACIEVNSF
ncbi:unnamed protein product [Brugia pahangi]|uniref:DUF1943 domain-containing protein n=1 Tax=Brugia pahangi TaxID=6280 RepID=A0A0N4TBX4_BRUPA|nr:unnamed protein product [Brugia pahangi]